MLYIFNRLHPKCSQYTFGNGGWSLLLVFLHKCEKYVSFLISLAFLMVYYFCNWTVNKLYI